MKRLLTAALCAASMMLASCATMPASAQVGEGPRDQSARHRLQCRKCPWCVVFVAHCFADSVPTIPLPKVAVRASASEAFGQEVKPCVGAVMRFARPGGGHLAFAFGEDATHFHVLGGNQGDRVSIMGIEKSRLVACQAPIGWTGPKLALPKMLAAAGIPISRNEA